ncbi:MAG: SIMPL domain-containing protein [Candidatus Limnocylindrales bacterium]
MAKTNAQQGSIVVSGEGRLAVAPDVADLRLGVSVSRLTVAEAREDAARTMEQILGAVAEAGIAKRDVRTSLLSVQPRYEYRDNQPPRLSGYELANVVEVTVRDLARLGDAVDGTLKAGATSMDGLSFRLADPSPAEREARMLAMVNARSRADVLAEAAGVRITGVESILEGGSMPQPRPFAKAERMMMAADTSTPVETGSLEVAVQVTVSYRTS